MQVDVTDVAGSPQGGTTYTAVRTCGATQWRHELTPSAIATSCCGSGASKLHLLRLNQQLDYSDDVCWAMPRKHDSDGVRWLMATGAG
jgi:hypothetical protein